ncbi:MAG: hypothetical protein ACTMUB_04055 [cyanobacterium endosymbiont of Rhopalodia musculus]|nr:hypothetical protein [cyanobacterium endosymbiont of Epithemia clementina EcSB]WGT67361.1 hypothetical protein P3F56_09195 [cyanobacterium endosymbiont of Epithemia clementina EcSB]
MQILTVLSVQQMTVFSRREPILISVPSHCIGSLGNVGSVNRD